MYSYERLCFPRWIRTFSNLVTLKVKDCVHCERFSSLGKLPSIKELHLSKVSVKYLDEDEFDNGVEMRIFPSLEVIIEDLPNLDRLLKVGREEMKYFLVFLF
jgi:hypothetical protein